MYSENIKVCKFVSPKGLSSLSLVTMTTIITGHHDVVSSVASWLPISSTICLCQMGGVGCASLREIPPPPHKKGEFWEGTWARLLNNFLRFLTSITWRQHQVKISVFSIIKFLGCGFQAPHSPLVSSSSSLVTSDHHPHQIFFGVRLLLLCQFHFQWFYQLGLMVGCQKDFQNRTQKTTKDARLGLRV